MDSCIPCSLHHAGRAAHNYHKHRVHLNTQCICSHTAGSRGCQPLPPASFRVSRNKCHLHCRWHWLHRLCTKLNRQLHHTHTVGSLFHISHTLLPSSSNHLCTHISHRPSMFLALHNCCTLIAWRHSHRHTADNSQSHSYKIYPNIDPSPPHTR